MAHELGIKICEALDIDKDAVSRIIIDVCANGPSRVYVQMYGSARLLDDIDWSSLKEFEVVILGPEAE